MQGIGLKVGKRGIYMYIKLEQVLVQNEARFILTTRPVLCVTTYSSARRRGCPGSPASRHTSRSGELASRHRTPRTSL